MRSGSVDPSLFEMKIHAARGIRMPYVGLMAVAKGLPMLLEAVAKVESATWILAAMGQTVECSKRRHGRSVCRIGSDFLVINHSKCGITVSA